MENNELNNRKKYFKVKRKRKMESTQRVEGKKKEGREEERKRKRVGGMK